MPTVSAGDLRIQIPGGTVGAVCHPYSLCMAVAAADLRIGLRPIGPRHKNLSGHRLPPVSWERCRCDERSSVFGTPVASIVLSQRGMTLNRTVLMQACEAFVMHR